MKKLLIIVLFFSLLVPVSAIQINEILSDPKTNSYDEWIEIYNQNNLNLNLSDWKVNDSAYTYDITCYNITNCSLITNSTYFIIIWKKANISAITNDFITYYNSSGPGNYWLTNNGETLTFYNSSYSINTSYTSSGKGKSWARIPDGSNNWTICSNPTPGVENYVFVEENITEEPNETIEEDWCDLSVSINSTEIITDNEIKYKLRVQDLHCQNIRHEYSIKYWIIDLFGNYLKKPYTSNYDIICSDTSYHEKKIEDICGTNSYYIEAEITNSGCNDNNSINNLAKQLVVVKGKSLNNTNCDKTEIIQINKTIISNISENKAEITGAVVWFDEKSNNFTTLILLYSFILLIFVLALIKRN